MPDNTLTFGWPEKGEPHCGDKSPGRPVLICERPVAHEGVHAALIKGDGNTIAWPGADGGTYAVTASDGDIDRRCTWEYQPGERCKRIDGHEGGHETDALPSRLTGAIVTDAQRLETIRRLAAQMEVPPHILTQDEVDEAARLVESNPYTITLPQYPDTEKVAAEEPAPYARATFTLTTEHGEIVRLAFEAHPHPTDENEWDYVASPVESIIRALRGIGYRG
jgi:hypothetical protein